MEGGLRRERVREEDARRTGVVETPGGGARRAGARVRRRRKGERVVARAHREEEERLGEDRRAHALVGEGGLGFLWTEGKRRKIYKEWSLLVVIRREFACPPRFTLPTNTI